MHALRSALPSGHCTIKQHANHNTRELWTECKTYVLRLQGSAIIHLCVCMCHALCTLWTVSMKLGFANRRGRRAHHTR